MIREIFAPISLGSYYVISQRIVGVEITKEALYATVVYAKGRDRIIEQCLQEAIEQGTAENYQERLLKAFQSLKRNIGKYDCIIPVISGSQVVFKELTLPFTDYEKIRMVAPFEVEAHLPFALDQAVLDSIVIQHDQQKSDIIVAAIKRDSIQDVLTCLEQAHIQPYRLTVDILEVYNVFCSIPGYKSLKEPVAILYFGATLTGILAVLGGRIVTLRVLPKGIPAHIVSLSSLTQEDTSAALKNLLRDISVTLDAFTSKTGKQPFSKIICSGIGADIDGLVEYVGTYFSLESTILPLSKIIHDGHVRAKHHVMITQAHVASLGAALSLDMTKDFSLLPDEIITGTEITMQRQIAVAFCLTLLAPVLLWSNTFWKTRKLHAEYTLSEKEAQQELAKKLNIPLKGSLESMNKVAAKEVEKRKGIWSTLSAQNRVSFLTYLQELSMRIDREALGLKLTQLTINENTDTMIIEGEVKDFKALQTLEEDLSRSKMFKEISKPQETKFSIRIALDRTYGEG